MQLRSFPESARLAVSGAEEGRRRKTVSSFEAFWVSMGARIGVGNIAGVGLAILMGGTGAIFWMWFFALIGAASSFAECTLGQIFKEKKSDGHYHGGPAYYTKNDLKNRKFSVFIALLIIVTYGIGFIGVQSANATDSFVNAFDFENNHILSALILTLIAGIIVFGGIKRVTKVSAKIVPVMAIM
ncbi:MAG: alanine:cation symporter family protein [Candidatus Methanomethylophilaceae archaeon]